MPILAGWSGGCAHQGEMQAAELGALPMNQGFQGYKTPSHPSQAPASSHPPSTYFLSCLMLLWQRGEVILLRVCHP